MLLDTFVVRTVLVPALMLLGASSPAKSRSLSKKRTLEGFKTFKASLLGWRPSLLGWRPSLLAWRPSLLGWRPLLPGWRPLLLLVGGHCFYWLEAIASRLEAIASRLVAIASRLEAIFSRLEAIAFRSEAIASIGWRPLL